MVCIEKRPYTLYGRLATLHFRYLTCLLDRGHINYRLLIFYVYLIYIDNQLDSGFAIRRALLYAISSVKHV